MGSTMMNVSTKWVSEWFNLTAFLGTADSEVHIYSPYKPCNHSLYIGISIFPHVDNTQFTGLKVLLKKKILKMKHKKWGTH